MRASKVIVASYISRCIQAALPAVVDDIIQQDPENDGDNTGCQSLPGSSIHYRAARFYSTRVNGVDLYPFASRPEDYLL